MLKGLLVACPIGNHCLNLDFKLTRSFRQAFQRFEHHEDRRSDKDRRNPFSPGVFGSGTNADQSEHRKGADRRR